MNEKVTKNHTIEIFNDTYTIKTDLSDAQLDEMTHLIDDQMRSLIQNHPTMNITRAAVITALSFCEELFQLRKSINEDSADISDDKIDQLIERIKTAL